jgi:hypothetical protein
MVLLSGIFRYGSSNTDTVLGFESVPAAYQLAVQRDSFDRLAVLGGALAIFTYKDII